MRPVPIVSGVLATVLAAVAALHLYWAAGGRSGVAVVPGTRGGRPLFVPSTASTVAVAAALLLAAWIVAERGGLAPRVGPRLAYTLGIWGVGLVLVARAVGDFRYVGLFKQVRGTPFAAMDDRLYTPLVAVLGVATLWLAVRGARSD
jgi:hypothetical protein